jgi:hypothetical protein
MTSTLDEVIILLKKWEADQLQVVLIVSNGPPDDPESYFFSVTGYVTIVSGFWVEVARDTDCCRLRLDMQGTSFQYVESRDPRLTMEDGDRELAEELFDGNLSVSYADGAFAVLTGLRERDDSR